MHPSRLLIRYIEPTLSLWVIFWIGWTIGSVILTIYHYFFR